MGTLAKTTPGNATEVLAPWALIKGAAPKIVEIDLRTKIEAVLHVSVGSTYITGYQEYGALVAVRRKMHPTATTNRHGPFYWSDRARYGSTAGTGVHHRYLDAAASALDTNFGWDGAAGCTFQRDDYVMLTGNTTLVANIVSGALGLTAGAAGCECARVTLIGSSGTTNAEIDQPLLFLHIDNELVASASVWDIPLEGGWLYDLIIDYKSEATATVGPIIAMAHMQTIDTYTSA